MTLMTYGNKHYRRIYDNIFSGSIWSQPPETRIVWLTMIHLKDGEGFIGGAVEWLARQANVSIEATKKALKVFSSPDPASRIPTHEGRKIKEVEGGWIILNHHIYPNVGGNGSSVSAARALHSSRKVAAAAASMGISTLKEKEKERHLRDMSAPPSDMSTLMSTGMSEAISGLSEAEFEAATSYSEGYERDVFLNMYERAKRAAEEGKPTFAAPQREIGREVGGCSQKHVSRIIKKMRGLRHVLLTKEHDQAEQLAAEYRWMLPTNLMLPAYDGPTEEDVF